MDLKHPHPTAETLSAVGLFSHNMFCRGIWNLTQVHLEQSPSLRDYFFIKNSYLPWIEPETSACKEGTLSLPYSGDHSQNIEDSISIP